METKVIFPKIRLPSISIFYGKPRSGKTYLMKRIIEDLSRRRQYDKIIIISPTAFTGQWDNIDTRYLWDELDEVRIYKIIDLQKTRADRGEEHRLLLVLDDCVGSANFRSNLFRRLATSSRHYNMSIMLSSQHLKCVPPVLRTCCDYSFIFHNSNKNDIDAVYNELTCAFFDNVNIFKAYLQKNTQDYKCILVDNRETNTRKALKIVRA
jgi:GTPase SAR1 family protein